MLAFSCLLWTSPRQTREEQTNQSKQMNSKPISAKYYISEFCDLENDVVQVEVTETKLWEMIAQDELLLDSDDREMMADTAGQNNR